MIELLVLMLIGLALWYPCCCAGEPPYDCPFCTTGTIPASVTVTLGGWGGNLCDCSFMNDSFVLPPRTGFACQWQFTDEYECNSEMYGYGMVALVMNPEFGDDEDLQWRVNVGVAADPATDWRTGVWCGYKWLSGGETPINCLTSRTLTAFESELTGPPAYLPCEDPYGETPTTCSIVPSAS